MLEKSVCPGRSARAGRKTSALLSLATLALSALIPSCSLTNIDRESCTSNDECVLSIGPMSQCTPNGYCTDPPACVTGHDCRKLAGGGACVNGFCVSTFPKDPQCTQIHEPADLLDARLAGPEAPLVIGSIYSLGELKDQVLTESVRLAVNEINTLAGLNNGKRMGVVVCDNGGPMNSAQGAERADLTNKAVDYLAGTLGVPYIVGPLSSADSLLIIGRLKEKNYPTVVISASATSPSLTQADDPLGNGQPGLFWRTCPSDVLQGEVMANNVIKLDTTVTKVAVIYSNDAYGQGLSTVFREQYGLMNSAIFPVDDAQFSDTAALANMATQVNDYAPNGVLVITVRAGDTIKILQALADTAAGNAKYFFTDGAKDAAAMFASTLPAKVQTIIAGSKGTAPASPSGNVYETFRANFNAKFQRDAAGFSFTAHAYDATYVGAYGVVWASRQNDVYDGNQVAEGMLQLSSGAAIDITSSKWPEGRTALSNGTPINVRGASGLLQFNSDTGEAPGDIEIWNVSGGKFATQQVVSPQ